MTSNVVAPHFVTIHVTCFFQQEIRHKIQVFEARDWLLPILFWHFCPLQSYWPFCKCYCVILIVGQTGDNYKLSWFNYLRKKASNFPYNSLLFKSAVPAFSLAAWRKIKLLIKSLSTSCQPPILKSPCQIHINLAHVVQLMRELWLEARRKGLTHRDVLLKMILAFKSPFFRVLYDIIP